MLMRQVIGFMLQVVVGGQFVDHQPHFLILRVEVATHRDQDLGQIMVLVLFMVWRMLLLLLTPIELILKHMLFILNKINYGRFKTNK
jgi:hypothetical protein